MTSVETLVGGLVGAILLWIIKVVAEKIITQYFEKVGELEKFKDATIHQQIVKLDAQMSDYTKRLFDCEAKILHAIDRIDATYDTLNNDKQQREAMLRSMINFVKEVKSQISSYKKGHFIKQGDVYIFKGDK